jgi:hypothetical protein
MANSWPPPPVYFESVASLSPPALPTPGAPLSSFKYPLEPQFTPGTLEYSHYDHPPTRTELKSQARGCLEAFLSLLLVLAEDPDRQGAATTVLETRMIALTESVNKLRNRVATETLMNVLDTQAATRTLAATNLKEAEGQAISHMRSAISAHAEMLDNLNPPTAMEQ